MNPRSLAYLVTAICLNALLLTATGATVVVPGDTADGGVQANGLIGGETLPTLRVGKGGDDARGHAAVYFFPLPAVSGVIIAADFQVGYAGLTPFTFPNEPDYNVDLYGIGGRANTTILPSDYYDGNPANTQDTLIQAALVIPTTSPAVLHTDTNGDANLLAFVSSLYQNDGTPTAAFAVFRANPSIDIVPNEGLTGYELASADNTDANGDLIPRLNLTVVPEPSGLILALCGATMTLWPFVYRRRNASHRAACD